MNAYTSLVHYGDFLRLKRKAKIKDIPYDWKPYGTKPDNPRWGISLTSLDGGMSGYPDLTSLNEIDEVYYEQDFTIPTEAFSLVQEVLEPWLPYLGRTHFIKLDRGGYFPVHRDNHYIEQRDFRLFLPIKGCNYPNMFFMLEDQLKHFDHGRLYFFNSCKEHSLFATGGEAIFMVANVKVTDESVQAVLEETL